ncbi:hypothetical protein N9J95_00165 [Candidatus Pelagibacter sp.]|nr:hypothetical protein [Candidatus Pelagibacter sp.]
MIIIEFFGPSGSGKSYFKKRLVKNFKFRILDYKSVYNLISDRSIIVKLFYSFIKLSYLQKIKNNLFISKIKKIFFGLIKTKKIDYENTIRIKKKLSKKIRFIKKLILNSKFSDDKKKIFENWANEELYVNHYSRKKIKKQKILIDSEGLIQRLFIYCYKKKEKKEIIKKYLDLIEIPKIIIFFNKKIVNKKNRIKIEENEEKKILKLTLLELKKKNILIIDSKIGISEVYLLIKKKLKL